MDEKTGRVLFSIAIGVLMITSVIGIVFVNYGSEDNSVLNYNGRSFERKGGFLMTKFNGKEVPFSYFPGELEEIPVPSTVTERIKGTRMVLVTSDYSSNFSQTIGAAEYDLGKALGEHFGVFVVQGFEQNATRLPIITCANATRFIPVVSFEESNTTQIREDGNCIILEAGSDEGFTRLRDRLLYSIFGVING